MLGTHKVLEKLKIQLYYSQNKLIFIIHCDNYCDKIFIKGYGNTIERITISV